MKEREHTARFKTCAGQDFLPHCQVGTTHALLRNDNTDNTLCRAENELEVYPYPPAFVSLAIMHRISSYTPSIALACRSLPRSSSYRCYLHGKIFPDGLNDSSLPRIAFEVMLFPATCNLSRVTILPLSRTRIACPGSRVKVVSSAAVLLGEYFPPSRTLHVAHSQAGQTEPGRSGIVIT